MDTAVKNSIASGATYVVAAGNSGDNACGYSPAEVAEAIIVGAIDPTNDSRDPNSNFGTCVKLFAPGVNILSDWNTSDTDADVLSGTSMATAHVSGVAARHLQTHTGDTPAAVWAAIHNADDASTTAGWAGVIMDLPLFSGEPLFLA